MKKRINRFRVNHSLWLFKCCKIQHCEIDATRKCAQQKCLCNYKWMGKIQGFKNIQPVENVRPIKIIKPIKCIQHMKNIRRLKKNSTYKKHSTYGNIQHMKNIQTIKSIQSFKNILLQKIVFPKVFQPQIFFAVIFLWKIFTLTAKKFLQIYMLYEQPGSSNYVLTNSMVLGHRCFLLLTLTVATAKLIFDIMILV